MSRPRELIGRLRRSPRALGVVAVVAVLVAAALLDVPGRLGGLAPPESPTRAAPTPTPTPSIDPGRLSNLKNADNQELDRCTPGSAVLARCGVAPPLGDGAWLNTAGGSPVSLDELRGSVVLVDFFSGLCVNCRRDARYLVAWEGRYRDAGLRIVGVHSPELDVEKDVDRLARTLADLSIRFPVLQDQGFETLTDYRTQVLPAKYLVDAEGAVRALSFGEGGAFRVEAQIRRLLAEASPGLALPEPVGELDDGEDAEPGTTPQIDLGASRGRRYDSESDTVVGDQTRFRLPRDQPTGTFSFGGLWRVGAQDAVPGRNAVARVSYRGTTAYQVIAGSGSLVVTGSDGVVRRVQIDGEPQLVRIQPAAEFGAKTLTVRYSGELQVFAFSFG